MPIPQVSIEGYCNFTSIGTIEFLEHDCIRIFKTSVLQEIGISTVPVFKFKFYSAKIYLNGHVIYKFLVKTCTEWYAALLKLWLQKLCVTTSSNKVYMLHKEAVELSIAVA